MNKARSGNLNDKAFEAIRKDIVSCTLKPGTAVTESRLVEWYGFGKAAIRHALTRLTQQGLTVNQGRRGYIVAPITVKSIRESYQIRRLIEPELCRLAAERLDDDIHRQLRACVDAPCDKNDKSQLIAFSHTNHDFHCLIARAAGNERLTRLIEELSDEHLRIAFVSMAHSQEPNLWSDDHKNIVAALERKQGDEAARLMLEHLVAGEKAVLAAVLELPELVEAQLTSLA